MQPSSSHLSEPKAPTAITLASLISAFRQSAKREWRFLSQHRWDFSLIFWLPAIAIILVWAIFSKGTIVDVPIAVIDHSHSPQSMTLIRYLDAAPEIAVVNEFYDQAAAQHAIQTEQVFAVVEIPTDFARNLLSGTPTRLLLNVNAQFGTHSGMVQKGVQSAVGTFSAGAEMKGRIVRGEARTQVTSSFTPIQTQSIGLFNVSNNYQQFLSMTVMPALLHILAMVIGASVVGRELRDKTIGEWYNRLLPVNKSSRNSPRSDTQLTVEPELPITGTTQRGKPTKPSFWLIIAGLNGKLIWAMLAYTLWGAVALSLTRFLQPVPLSSLMVTYLCFLIFMMLSFWMGVIVTVNSFSYRQGLSSTGFISAPSFAFSRVTFPLVAMSPAAQYWAKALPLTHYLQVQIPQLQMYAPPSLAVPSIYGFTLATLISLMLSALLTRRALTRPDKWGQR